MKSLNYLIILSTALALSACDVSTDSSLQEEQNKFTVTNDVINRITYYNSSPKVTAEPNNVNAQNAQTGGLTFFARIAPPSNARASQVSISDDGEMLIGYKLVNEPYGGGFDFIPDFSSSSTDDSRSYQNEDIDVQEVIFSSGSDNGDSDKFYVAAATESLGGILFQANMSGDITSATDIEGNVAKALDIGAPSNSNPGDAPFLYVISDLNHLYRFTTSSDELPDIADTEEYNLITNDDSPQFRSVTARGNDQVFTLGLNGTSYRTNNSFNGFNANPLNLTNGGSLDSDLSIARLTFMNMANPDVLLVALNEYGFRVVNPASQNVFATSEDIDETGSGEEGEDTKTVSERHYISLTGDDVDHRGNPNYTIYAAALGNIIDVFDYQNNGKDRLNYIDRIKLTDFTEYDFEEGQINHIALTDDYLIVAKGTEGVFIFERP